MSQKERILSMLRAAGSFGVRSDTYIKEYMPRASARIKELREEGYNITSEREGKYTRWTLIGVEKGTPPQAPSTAASTGSERFEPAGPAEPSLFEETSLERLSDVA